MKNLRHKRKLHLNAETMRNLGQIAKLDLRHVQGGVEPVASRPFVCSADNLVCPPTTQQP